MRAAGRDDGSATIEFALLLPALVGVLALAFSAVGWGLRIDAAQRGASEAARAAITDTSADAAVVGARVAGAPATVVSQGEYVSACVVVRQPPWPTVSRCAAARLRP